MTWQEARERKRRLEDAIFARGGRSDAKTRSEDRQFAYHREAAFNAPWTGTDAYTFMRNARWRTKDGRNTSPVAEPRATHPRLL
jgi:hypothetical protein